METCSVCVETFNKSNRKKVTCPFCQYESCALCTKTFILSDVNAPHCMNCNKAWSRYFLSTVFSIGFLNKEYRNARADMLFQLERSTMPDTQKHLEIYKTIRGLRREYNRNNADINELKRSRRTSFTPEMKRVEIDLRKRIETLTLENEYILFVIDHLGGEFISREKKERRAVSKACGQEGCRGFINENWVCCVCEVPMCRMCHEMKRKDEEHTCDENTIKTVEELNSSAYRPCPKCTTMIFKIDGCRQMFCTNPSCHTAFDWVSGNIITGNIHNPHYYEYMNRTGGGERVAGDIQCGGLIGINDLLRFIRNIVPTTRNMNNDTPGYKIIAFHRHLVEFSDPMGPNAIMVVNEVEPFYRNLKERIQYMLGEIPEETFKTLIHQRDKHMLKKRELAMIATTAVQIMTDIYARITQARTKEDITNLETEVEHASGYINHLFENVSRAFSCVAPRFQWIGIKNHAYFKS